MRIGLKNHNQGVIPAQAGIHNHRPISYCKNLEASGIWIPAGVYPGFGAGMTKVCLLLLCLLWHFSAHAEEAYQTFNLKNGLEVIVIPNHRIPAVTHMIWYKTGAINEKPGKTGIAHYLEHLMFKGTGLTKAGEFSSAIARNGGHDNAFTTYDYTAYFQVIPKESLEKVMTLESDRMVNLKVPENEAVNEKQVVLEERRSRLENNPKARLLADIRAELYKGYPYANTVIGVKSDIENLSLNDVMNFYHAYYAPNNAILVVSGDVTPEEVRNLAEKYYANIPARDIPKPVWPEAQPVQKHLVTLHDKTVKQNELFVYFRAPSVNSKDKEMAFPLLLLSEILGGGPTSRLYQDLITTKKQAVEINSYYSEIALGTSEFAIQAIPAAGADFKTLENSIDGEIAAIAKGGVTAEELARAKNLLESEVIYSHDSLRSLAFIYGEAAASNLPADYVAKWPGNIEAVTPAEITAAAKYLAEDKNKVTGYLAP